MSTDTSPLVDGEEELGVTNLKRLGDDHWEIRCTYTEQPSGKRRNVRRRFRGSWEEAVERRNEIVRGIERGRPTKARRKNLMFGDLFDEFVEARQSRGRWEVSHSTHKRENSQLEKHVLPEVSQWQVTQMEHADLGMLTDLWARKTKDDGSHYSPASVNGWIRTARIFFKFCSEQVGRDTAWLQDWKGLSESRISSSGRSLTREEKDQLLTEIRDSEPQFFAVVHTLVSTGQRFSSVSALRWSDIEFSAADHGVIHFRRSQDGGVVTPGEKKGRQISLPMPESLSETLRWHQEMSQDLHIGYKKSDLVFAAKRDPDQAERGGFMTPSAVNKALRRACERAGIDRITPHDLRRTFVTLALEAGASPERVRSITGHCESMLRHYLQSTEQGRREVLESVADSDT